MPQEDLSKLPKLFAENITVAFNPEIFVMLIASGESKHVFALSPGHIKRLGQYITHQVQEFEKQSGTIPGPNWSPNQTSPIQPPDLNPKK